MPTLQKQSISVTAKVITVFEIHNRPLHRRYAFLARYQVPSRTITQITTCTIMNSLLP